MPKHQLYIETVGCQMNVLDSEMLVASLRKEDYEITDHLEQADTILFNTCSVREQAENKVYSALGRLRQHKQENPDKVVGVIGCMAQKDQKLIFDRAPYVDLVVGPGQLQKVPEIIREVRKGNRNQMAVSLGRKEGSNTLIKRSHETFDPLRDPQMRPTPSQAYLRIQIGCDKFCTYCIVPSVRGPEQGRAPEEILSEAKTLAEQGCLEITLVGQTVNSYRYNDGNKTTTLADLLEELHKIEGIRRLKFVTNYPKDMSDHLLEVVRDYPKVSPYLHVPLQSGSNEVLKRMKRGYTVEDYHDMMERIHATIPGAAVSSDFIVGFCGETEEEFQRSVEAVKKYRFKNSFIFKYSERPGTKGANLWEDDIPHVVKQERNRILLETQSQISEELNLAFLGKTVDILVEGPSKSQQRKSEDATSEIIQLTGRTHCDRIVLFEGNRRLIDQILPVSIYDTTPYSLFGAIETHEYPSALHSLTL
ncbi:MAG: tRNA (N6-isopentenyl adenosine(37)-C2)-methylthiotransferase MiaB [Pirellulaceae bacterium]|nr:tRNA (N6-isopentenyl adenosine(37)-C2)-methylthiotransferase MiaB [Pirellulaceae bacterium]